MQTKVEPLKIEGFHGSKFGLRFSKKGKEVMKPERDMCIDFEMVVS